jgi:hypothetical protein
MWDTLTKTEKNNLLSKWQRDAIALLKKEGITELSNGNLRRYYLKGYIAERREQMRLGDQYVESTHDEDEWHNTNIKIRVKDLKQSKIQYAFVIHKGEVKGDLVKAFYIRIGEYNFFYSTPTERDADYRKVNSILVQKMQRV